MNQQGRPSEFVTFTLASGNVRLSLEEAEAVRRAFVRYLADHPQELDEATRRMLSGATARIDGDEQMRIADWLIQPWSGGLALTKRLGGGSQFRLLVAPFSKDGDVWRVQSLGEVDVPLRRSPGRDA